MELSQNILMRLLGIAQQAHPQECCGLLLGQGGVIKDVFPTANVHPSPHTHFEIDPVALIAASKAEREGGCQIIGYYHSHPFGPPAPSKTDIAMAARDGKIWAIIGQGRIRLWRDTQDGFVPMPRTDPAG